MKKSTFIILCLEGAVLSFNVAAAAALVPSIAKDFALSQFFVGKIVWLYMLPYGLAALIYGPLVRTFNAKKIELVCLFFFSLANLLVGLAQNIYLLFFGRFLMGFFGASVIPLALILIGKHVETQKRGRAVGIFFGMTFTGSLLGLFLSGILPWRLIFLLPAIAGFLTLALIYFYLPSFPAETKALKINYLPVFRNKKILAIFTYIFFISLLYHGVQQWLGVYFSRQYAFPQFIISMLIMLTSLSGSFGEVLGGWLADKAGRAKTINSGLILMILSVLLLVFKAPLSLLIIVMVIWGLGWTFNHAGVSTMLTDMPENFLHESASLNSSVRFIAGGIGAVLGGIFLQESFTSGFLAFALALILLLFSSKQLLNTRS